MDVRSLRKHWQDEGESAFIYQKMAALAKTAERRDIFARLADVETRHQRIYRELLSERGEATEEWRPALRVRLLAWLAERGRVGLVMSLRIADESREVRTYLKRKKSGDAEETANQMRTIAQEEAHHAHVLSQLAGGGDEPWHQKDSGGFLRNVIYGFNDGLTANFGLVMGVVGGAVPSGVMLLTGFSGLVADALSMGGSGFLAAKSEREVWDHEIAMEREEIQLMPETETEELALLYQAKGMPAEAAKRAAAQVMSDPEIAVREHAREELGISGDAVSPMREAVTTGISTAVGAFIPVVPFVFGTGPAALWTAFAISMLAHFVVGAARSIFTGRGVFRSGFDMFIVGLGVAAAGYGVGALLTGRL